MEHYACYLKEKHLIKRIGFFDIESFDLWSDWGWLICWCIKELNGKIHSSCITPAEIRDPKKLDKRLLEDLLETFHKFDTLVVYFGADKKHRHDFPFCRGRSLHWDLEDFPRFHEKKIIDLYDIVSTKLRLKRNRMQCACDLLHIPSKHHPMNPEIWQAAALSGSKKALHHILEHCKEDVCSTEMLYNKVYEYKPTATTS